MINTESTTKLNSSNYPPEQGPDFLSGGDGGKTIHHATALFQNYVPQFMEE